MLVCVLHIIYTMYYACVKTHYGLYIITPIITCNITVHILLAMCNIHADVVMYNIVHRNVTCTYSVLHNMCTSICC